MLFSSLQFGYLPVFVYIKRDEPTESTTKRERLGINMVNTVFPGCTVDTMELLTM